MDHIGLCETDRYGNCVKLKTIKMPLKGKSTNQRKHIIGNVEKEAIRHSQNLRIHKSHEEVVDMLMRYKKSK